ncbi:MAG: hypothetical protein J6C33_03220 [Lachnospiraceae bacterium]|nr:hypothetical protein [Lachnospiraceae bacterium]
MDKIRILQLSDLCFGTDDAEERDERLYDLLRGIKKISEKGKVDYILVTKGVTCEEFASQYQEARAWMADLSGICRVPIQKMYLCLENVHEASGMWLYEYELNPAKEEGENCVRTAYEFEDGLWKKSVCCIHMELSRRNKKEWKDAFSVLWWMRIGME